MDPWQTAQQIKYKLQNVRWAGGGGSVVFGERGVRIFAGTPTEEQIPPVFPFCLVGIGRGVADEYHHELIDQSFDIVPAVFIAGDPLGEHSVIGGSAADSSKSPGRGIAEVAERVRSAVQDLTGADGAGLFVSAAAVDVPSPLGRGRHLTISPMTLSAWCTSQKYYAPPQRIEHSSGIWTWEGTHCSDRFDFLHYKLVRKSGSSPSANYEDGTTVYTGTAATFTGAKTSGNTYTLFAGYSARGKSTADDYSEPEVGSYLVAL